MSVLKLKDSGKEHRVGDPRCPACDQRALDDSPLIPSVKHFPFIDSTGNPPCGGLVHSEVFGDRNGCEILYRCDRCGSFH